MGCMRRNPPRLRSLGCFHINGALAVVAFHDLHVVTIPDDDVRSLGATIRAGVLPHGAASFASSFQISMTARVLQPSP